MEIEKFHTNGDKKGVGMDIFILDKIDFQQKLVMRDKECHFIVIKGSIYQEDVTIVHT